MNTFPGFNVGLTFTWSRCHEFIYKSISSTFNTLFTFSLIFYTICLDRKYSDVQSLRLLFQLFHNI